MSEQQSTLSGGLVPDWTRVRRSGGVVIHLGRWPLRWAAACGADRARLTSELDLVDCGDCREAVLRAELLSIPLPRAMTGRSWSASLMRAGDGWRG